MAFINNIKKAIKNTFPSLTDYYQRHNNPQLLHAVIEYCESLKTPEAEKRAKFYRKHGLVVFPYDFIYDDIYKNIEVFRDSDGHAYVLHHGKKLYGKFGWSDEELRSYYRGLCIEQDKRSPHCYFLREEREPEPGDVVADCGAAEGIFSLDVVEKASKVYLFECDETWIGPLKKTFEPYMDKIEIVSKFIGDKTQDGFVSLDDFFQEKAIDFVKADIEGAEILLLKGGVESLKNKIQKVLLCTYHHPGDADMIAQELQNLGMNTEFNPGEMLFIYDCNPLTEPYFRRGVIYGYRNK